MASYLAITDVDRYRLDRRHSTSGIPIRSYLTESTPRKAERTSPDSAMLDFIEKLVAPTRSTATGGHG